MTSSRFALNCLAGLLLLTLSATVRALDPIQVTLEFTPDLDNGRRTFEICARCHLPEAWGNNPAGAYSTGGTLPEVRPNVRLHAGLFADSLPAFLEAQPGPIRFMNVDCDLYSSTKCVFDLLAGRVAAGSVIVFDEYICTESWREDEFRAFQEAVAANAWTYEYLAFGLFTKQAAVIIR